MLTARIPPALPWVIISPSVVPCSLGHPIDRRLSLTLPAKLSILPLVKPAARLFGCANSSRRYTYSNPILPFSFATTMALRPFLLIRLTTPEANTLMSVIILSANMLKMDPSPFGASLVLTMSPIFSPRPYRILTSLASGPILDSSDACARRSLFCIWLAFQFLISLT
jgi:hypothetical protein